MKHIALAIVFLLAACGAPDLVTLRATHMPNPTNVPATPGPSPTPAPVAYPYPAPQAVVAPAPPLTARWDSAISATIAWSGHSCVSVHHATGQRVFIGCYDGGVRLGGAQTDGAFRPRAGDVYVLDSGERAVLVGRAQYLPVWR